MEEFACLNDSRSYVLEGNCPGRICQGKLVLRDGPNKEKLLSTSYEEDQGLSGSSHPAAKPKRAFVQECLVVEILAVVIPKKMMQVSALLDSTPAGGSK